MSGVVTDPIDIQKYKCVPLDLLRNVSQDSQVQFNASQGGVSLKDFMEQSDEAKREAGPIAGDDTFDAETIENILISFVVIFFILFALIIFFYFGLNLSTNGLGTFGLPSTLKGLPVIALAALLFLALGFVIGYFVRR